MNIHNPSYPCPVVNCEKAFHRKDKVIPHLLRFHDLDDSTHCPIADCQYRLPLPLDLLQIHAGIHWTSHNVVLVALCEWRFRKFACSITSCKKLCDLKQFTRHLKGHRAAERKASGDAMRALGRDPVTTDLMCPFCSAQFLESQLDVLRFHLQETHLSIANTEAHELYGCCVCPQLTNRRWNSWWDRHKERQNGCSKCKCPPSRLLVDISTVLPYRQQILRLDYNFQYYYYPVFNDIKTTPRT
ncbi:hypothetical protein P154DRAFT_211647 [Amniculicola lignicola CBS 123094]|uniref:C2H2-type domain-containing protein n=1 Tax=Amniculicola lignicola CBS 123094 TaxID=1392246 RepID=A0A6A5WEN6_9PLEO|nr:hypothetical protein P154DRAFT_211647 [Amniculicola lignicola CBS 123094]